MLELHPILSEVPNYGRVVDIKSYSQFSRRHLAVFSHGLKKSLILIELDWCTRPRLVFKASVSASKSTEPALDRPERELIILFLTLDLGRIDFPEGFLWGHHSFEAVEHDVAQMRGSRDVDAGLGLGEGEVL